jgi:hypothetical protein
MRPRSPPQNCPPLPPNCPQRAVARLTAGPKRQDHHPGRAGIQRIEHPGDGDRSPISRSIPDGRDDEMRRTLSKRSWIQTGKRTQAARDPMQKRKKPRRCCALSTLNAPWAHAKGNRRRQQANGPPKAPAYRRLAPRQHQSRLDLPVALSKKAPARQKAPARRLGSIGPIRVARRQARHRATPERLALASAVSTHLAPVRERLARHRRARVRQTGSAMG